MLSLMVQAWDKINYFATAVVSTMLSTCADVESAPATGLLSFDLHDANEIRPTIVSKKNNLFISFLVLSL